MSCVRRVSATELRSRPLPASTSREFSTREILFVSQRRIFGAVIAIAPCLPTETELPTGREGRVATEHRAPRGNTVTTRDRRRRNFLLYIYENPPRPSTATTERVMASKMPKKRARIDAAAAKDSTSSPSVADVGPSRCPPSQPSDATAHPKVRCQGRN